MNPTREQAEIMEFEEGLWGSGFADKVEQGGKDVVAKLQKWSAPQEGIHDDILRGAGSTGKFLQSLVPTTPEEMGQELVDMYSSARIAKGNPLGTAAVHAGKKLIQNSPEVAKAVKVATDVASPYIKKGKEFLEKDWFENLPGYQGRQLATAGVPNMSIGKVNQAVDLTNSRPLQAASDPRLSATTHRNWNKLRDAAIGGDRLTTASLLRESSPNFQNLSKRNQYIKVNELAADPDLILDLVGRNKEVGDTFKEYIRALGTGDGKRASTIGRSLNDIASKNPLDPSTIIYGNKTIRDRLKNKFVEFTGQEWHHVFGSKEIGETMLTKLSGEPMMAANIFKFLDEVGVPTSGTAKNMALMSKAKHTGKGTSYHDWAKSTGFEPWTNPASSLKDLGKNQRLSQQLTGEKRLRYPEGKFTAPLDFPDLMKSVSESVLKGEAHVDEFMDMLRTYAKSVRPHTMKKLKDFDARIVSDIEGVERVILDKPYIPNIGTRGRKKR